MQVLKFLYFLTKNMDYHMQFKEFISLLQKHGLPYAIFENCFSSPKAWTIICHLSNIIPFSQNMDYHFQFLKFLSLLQKRGLSYAITVISFPSPKTWTIICNF